ncbi:hypothetical protein PInf_007396 [Phytophthora infestans]|nr:hypothetical protein PInf_007396 [Phytophthora infestans]
MTQYPAWDELDEIFRDLHDLYDKSLLTLREQEYAAVLTQATVNVLAQACLTSEGGDLDASGVRVKLLELAVLPSPQWRRLALTLFLNTIDWVDQAVGCVEFFVKKANGNYSSDHLRSLDEHTLLFLVAEASNRDTIGSELQLKAMELVVATMYALKVTGQLETKDHVVWNCGLPVAAVEQYVSLELLLYHFYTSPIARLQRLACMVLVDLVCEQLRRTGSREGISNAGLDQIWRSFVDWEDPPEGMKQTLLSPYISSSRVVKQLLPSCSLASEKQLNVFVNQFRLVVQVDAYFGVNPGLDKAVKAAKNQSGGNVSEEIIDQVLKLLLSNRAVERFRGERWLAELLSYDQDDDGFSSYDSKATTAVGSVGKQHEVLLARPKAVNNPVGEELEETFCYDEGGEISLAAQAKFWQLASPTNAVERRVSFTRVLALFIRRKLQLSSGKPDASIMEEINTCVGVLLDHKEREPAVLLPVMLLILEVCQCELSYVDKRWKQRDARTSSNEQGEEEVADCVAWSDSLASRVLNGDVALDKKLLRQMDAEFLLHVLTVLHERSDTHQVECRRICCGVDDSLVGDVAACTALVVCSIFTDNNVAVDNVGGLTALTPFLQTCDTRIAVFMAKLISELMKQSDEAQYAAFLRELYVACVEADDESALYNSYLHTQTLLHNVEVGM